MNSGRPPPPVFTKKSVSFNAGFPNPLDWWKCQPKKMLNPPRRQLVLRLYTERSLPIPIRDPSYHQSRPFGLRCNCVFVYMQAFKAANVMSSHRSDPCCSSSKDTATRKSLRTLYFPILSKKLCDLDLIVQGGEGIGKAAFGVDNQSGDYFFNFWHLRERKIEYILFWLEFQI